MKEYKGAKSEWDGRTVGVYNNGDGLICVFTVPPVEGMPIEEQIAQHREAKVYEENGKIVTAITLTPTACNALVDLMFKVARDEIKEDA